MLIIQWEGSPISAKLWSEFDKTVVATARNVLTGRRFLNIYDPLGAGVQSINTDNILELHESEGDISVIKERYFKQIPLINQDFTLFWRDIEFSEKMGIPYDLSMVSQAALQCSVKEDQLIFQGCEEHGYKGFLNEEGTLSLPKSDWEQGENPFRDVSEGLAKFIENGVLGRRVLVISPKLFVQLQRIQPGTGITEYDRISKLLNGNIFKTPVLKENQALLLCPEPQNMDLVIGQDMITAYLETKNLNHVFRVVETVMLRIKNKKAVIVFV